MALSLALPVAIPPLYLLIPALFLLYQTITTITGFRRNLLAARRSNIPYILAPWFHLSRLSLTLEPLWVPLFSALPTSLTHPWLTVSPADWVWKQRYDRVFRDIVGADTFLVVAPGRNVLYTADADVISEICRRRTDFVKPIEIYGILDIFGKSVVTVEGSEWRRHRRVTGAQFNEGSNAVVFKESIFQAQEMVRCWGEGFAGEAKEVAGSEEGGGKTIVELGKDTMKLSLHVISRAGFGVRCLWPSKERDRTEELPEGSMSPDTIPKGHKLSYVESMEFLLHHVILLILFPAGFLKRAPFKLLRKTHLAFVEWGSYMSEIYDRALTSPSANDSETPAALEEGGLDLMGAMVKASGLSTTSPADIKPGTGLTPTEIMGNSFVMFLAGHETAANTLYFATLYLALRPSVQRKLQKELDEIFEGVDSPAEWSYEEHLPKLFAGWAGAIMNEELRLIPPVVNIPKSTLRGQPQAIRIGEKECVVPEHTYINLCAVCVHRNPKYWPTTEKEAENDLDDFRPERWFTSSATADAENGEKGMGKERDADTGVDLSSDTAGSMFKPVKGSYIPFSEGFRSCLGRRFAQVEILAALAVIFKDHSIELLPLRPSSNPPRSKARSRKEAQETMTESEIRNLGEEEKERVWDETAAEVHRKIRDETSTIITLQMRGAPVRLRVCRRGEEVWDRIDR